MTEGMEGMEIQISHCAGLNPTQLCQLTIILTKEVTAVFETITSFSEVKKGPKFSQSSRKHKHWLRIKYCFAVFPCS